MKLEEFVNQKEFDNLKERINKIEDDIKNNSYNIFSISSYNTRLENYHSDVISLLLNPLGPHNQSTTYLFKFIELLNTFELNINSTDYSKSEVTREKGRIDIWIKSNESRKCILIENKINNAMDQDDQIRKYYNYAYNNGYQVEAIIYLGLDGNQKAPLTNDKEIDTKTINIAAFTSSKNDLCTGWLEACYQISNSEANRSFIFQYIKLLKHLSQTGLDRNLKKDFYRIVNQNSEYEKAIAISKLIQEIDIYRTDTTLENIGNDILPFRKMYRYKPNHFIFENFCDNGIKYKLDVHFIPGGHARVDFWSPDQQNDNVDVSYASQKLESIGLLGRFQRGGFGGGMYKLFRFDSKNNLSDIDNELVGFVKLIFGKLRH